MKRILFTALAVFSVNAMAFEYPCVSITRDKDLGYGLKGYQANPADQMCLFQRFQMQVCQETQPLCRHNSTHMRMSGVFVPIDIPVCSIAIYTDPKLCYKIYASPNSDAYEYFRDTYTRSQGVPVGDGKNREKFMNSLISKEKAYMTQVLAPIAQREQGYAANMLVEINQALIDAFNLGISHSQELIDRTSLKPHWKDLADVAQATGLNVLKDCLYTATSKPVTLQCYANFETAFNAAMERIVENQKNANYDTDPPN